MSKTKIVIIQLKEIIYTAIFVGLGILLILLLVFMFLPKNKEAKPPAANAEAIYHAGVYSSQLTLGNTSLNVEVVVDSNHINSVQISNLNDSVTTMFPLVEPALASISHQLSNNVAIGDIVISEDSKYTQTLLLEAIDSALKKAEK